MTTVMSRSMILPVSSRNEWSVKLFFDHVLKTAYGLILQNELYSSKLNRFEENTINPIGLGPGVVVYLDQVKKQKFLEEWGNAIIQSEY